MAVTLAQEHLESLRKAKVSITDLRGFVAQAKRAGMDMSAIEKELADKEKQVNQLRDGFFPGQTL